MSLAWRANRSGHLVTSLEICWDHNFEVHNVSVRWARSKYFPSTQALRFITTTLKQSIIHLSAWIMSSVPIRNSVTKISDSIWRLGCTIECNRTAEPDDTCAAAWKDGEDWYILRHTTSEQLPDATSANSPVRLIHEGGTLSAVWAIGNNAICKVHPGTLIPLQRAKLSNSFKIRHPKYLYPK